MKVTIKHIDSEVPKENYDFFNNFIKYSMSLIDLEFFVCSLVCV